MSQWRWIFDPSVVSKPRADVAISEALAQGHGEWQPEAPTDFYSTRSQVQNWIEAGTILLNGAKLLAKTHPVAGDEIVFNPAPSKKLELEPINIPIEILFEDDHLAVINKPQGMSVHPSESDPDPTLVHALLYHMKSLSSVGGVERPGIVHRIDKNTSGAIVVSKNDRTHLALAELFSKHDIDRVYWALCYSRAKRKVGEWKRVETLLGRNSNDRMKMCIDPKEGRPAITDYRYLETYGSAASWIEAKLYTGRTHQVRVHLTNEGHSIFGDTLYGLPTQQSQKWKELPQATRNQILALPGQALHARSLGFVHPITGEKLNFEAEPPAMFSLLIAGLREFAVPK